MIKPNLEILHITTAEQPTSALLFLSGFFLSSFEIYPSGSDVKPGEVCLIPPSFTHTEKEKNKCIMKHFYGSHNNSKDFFYYIKNYKNDFNHLTPKKWEYVEICLLNVKILGR